MYFNLKAKRKLKVDDSCRKIFGGIRNKEANPIIGEKSLSSTNTDQIRPDESLCVITLQHADFQSSTSRYSLNLFIFYVVKFHLVSLIIVM